LIENPDIKFKALATRIGSDQRTIAKRIKSLKESGVIKLGVEVDWAGLGLQARAFVGSDTALGEKAVAKLIEFLRSDPRIIEAYQTVGTNEYVMYVIEKDLPSLRDSVLNDLEPLTADLKTSVIASEIKRKDQLSLIRYLRTLRYPRSISKP